MCQLSGRLRSAEDFQQPHEQPVHLRLILFHEVLELREIDFSAFESIRVIVDQSEAVITKADFRAKVRLMRGRHSDHVTPTLDNADLRFGFETRTPELHVNLARMNRELRGELLEQQWNQVIRDSRCT